MICTDSEHNKDTMELNKFKFRAPPATPPVPCECFHSITNYYYYYYEQRRRRIQLLQAIVAAPKYN